jgi:hypothetical protein
MNRKKILVIVRSEQKGLYTGIAVKLASKFSVEICTDNQTVANSVKRICPGIDCPIRVLPERRIKHEPNEATLTTAKALEKKYRTKIAFLISSDRNLGRGYLTNIDRYVETPRMTWPHLVRLQQVIGEFKIYENLFAEFDVVISQYPESIPLIVCEARNIKHFHLLPVKFGSRCFWSTDGYQGSPEYVEAIQEAIRKTTSSPGHETMKYQVDAGGDMVNKSVEYEYSAALRQAGRIIVRDLLELARQLRKPNSVRLFGWAPSRFRKVRNYKFVKRHSFEPGELSNYKIAYFALHMEPEVTLLQFSPEFVNTLEAVVWISKSLPADWVLVVKEQSNAYQFRSESFYQRLRQISNVALGHPDVESWEWIRNSSLVATITGTVGQEGVYFRRPVLSFGRHQIINYLPTVFPVRSFEETLAAVDRIAQGQINEGMLIESRQALFEAQMTISFDLPHFKHGFKHNAIDKETVGAATEELEKRYPGIFAF